MVPADIASEADVQNLVAETVKWTSRVDVLINNAAAMRINKPPEETTVDEWRSVMDTNVTGAWLCCREAGKVMIGQQSGKIVNIASISGHVVNKYFHGGAYEVSKAALMMLTRTLATEWAPYNISVNAIAPGYYDTQPNRDFFAQEADLYQRVLDLIPLRRLGNLEELTDLVLMLASRHRQLHDRFHDHDRRRVYALVMSFRIRCLQEASHVSKELSWAGRDACRR